MTMHLFNLNFNIIVIKNNFNNYRKLSYHIKYFKTEVLTIFIELIDFYYHIYT